MWGNRIENFTRHWRWWVFLFWIVSAAGLVMIRWNAIHWFTLSDTDDNLRMAQVRALLDGQDWFDLRQYKLNPPFGADIHWSRLVDLPIAGLKLLFMPIFGGKTAETIAVAVAPMLPMLAAMLAMAGVVRRLVDPKAFILGAVLLLCAQSARGMWIPLRLDHHGWQLALLSIVLLGLVDRKAARGGAIAGIATAASLTIGLEMLLYLALAGAMTGLMWVRNEAQARRLAVYGASLAGGSAIGFLLFASYANRVPVCDALSPVWLSVMVAAGALAFLLSVSRLRSGWTRLIAAGGAGLLLAVFYVYFWPDCVGRLERATPELQELWLSRVREAMPLYAHGWKTIVAGLSLPLAGLAGYATMLWRCRRDETRLIPWVAAAALALLAACLLLWQTRAGPAAQLLAVPGAAALIWLLLPWILSRTNPVVRVLGATVLLLIFSGIGPQYVASRIPDAKPGARSGQVAEANGKCPTLASLRPVALQPAGIVLTHVDLGPRLITVTHHKAIAGPYHRNGDDIIAVMRAFRGSAENARQTIKRRHIDYVLICPNLSETTVYRSQAPNGFYVQLVRGQVPTWLDPVELPKNSPYRMWRVKR
ncbi:MAG: AcrB/AcrD/AcrF family protein [Sphingosinicella sp.]|nr:AcrB/AcrD/AcrF family protein [Sphingosinicella sp.]